MFFNRVFVLFVVTMGISWIPDGHMNGFASAKPFSLDDVVEEITKFRSAVPLFPGWWLTEKGYLWLEKEFNIPTNYGSKIAEASKRNIIQIGDKVYYEVNAHDVYGPINIQTKNTINADPSTNHISFGPKTVQAENSYGSHKD